MRKLVLIIGAATMIAAHGAIDSFQGVRFGSAPEREPKQVGAMRTVTVRGDNPNYPTGVYRYSDKNRLWQIHWMSKPLAADAKACQAEVLAIKAMLEKECHVEMKQTPCFLSKSMPPEERKKWEGLQYLYKSGDLMVHVYVSVPMVRGTLGQVRIQYVVSNPKILLEDRTSPVKSPHKKKP